jgi:tRNA modification GTPase
MTSDTIYALATAPGKSGVAVIRLSGPQSLAALRALTGKEEWRPGMLARAEFGGIDSGMGVCFRAPKSFTGEDVAELHLHGGLAVIRAMLDALSRLEGLRPAEAGEFTRRAYLNGKMDLVEAEGLADLIAAQTPRQHAQALSHLQGGGSRFYEGLRAETIAALARLEATIDFPDEEIPAETLREVGQGVKRLQSAIGAALADKGRGERTRGGFHIVILGAPNVGKSSLLNRLAGRDAAIVSARAGTTRDVIEVHMDIAGYPVVVSDTAGLRDTADDIEEEGVRRARARGGDADLKLALFAGEKDPETLAMVDDKTLIIHHKMDVLGQGDDLSVSSKSGQGMGDLLAEMERRVVDYFSGGEAPVITRARHRALLERALQHLSAFSPDDKPELACENLRRAAVEIGKITGKIQVDELLDVVFGEFCIGK